MRSDLLSYTELEPLDCRGKSLPIYSLCGGEVLSPEQANALYVHAWQGDLTSARNAYPVLPWVMGEVLQTTWRNVFSGIEVHLTHLALDGWQHISLFGEYHTRRGVLAHELGLGFWIDGRYVLEGWIRTDLWPAASQIPWFAWEAYFISQQIAHLEEQIASVLRFDDRINSRAYQRERDERLLDLRWVSQQRAHFTAMHEL